MASETEICNLAISHLGVGKEIQNIETDNSDEAAACRRFFDTARDATLRDSNWPFATKIATLALVEEEPNDEWAYSYRYPTDCLKVRRILSGSRNDTQSTRARYRVARDSGGLLIYSDTTDAEVEYTVREEDPQVYPPDFMMAFSYRLAHYIAPRVAGGEWMSLADRALKLYAMEIKIASSTAFNEEVLDEQPDSEFITTRNT